VTEAVKTEQIIAGEARKRHLLGRVKESGNKKIVREISFPRRLVGVS